MSVGAVNKQTGDRIPTAGLPDVDSVLSGISTNPVQNRVVKEALDGKADTDMVAADFDATASYTAGNYCIYEGKFYKFKNNHSGAWSAADVDEIKIAGELSALKSGLTNYKAVIGYDEVYNQWDELWEVGSIDTTTGENTDNSSVIRSSGYIPVKPNTQYFFKAPSTGVAFFYGSNKAFISQSSTNVWQIFTTPANAYYMRFRLSSDYGDTYNNDVSVNYPATVTSYYPYHGAVDARLDNLANPLGTYNVMGIFQTSQLYNNSYGIAVVTGFDPSIHTATINSASTLDGTNLTLTYNPYSTKKGVICFFVEDATVLGKIVNVNITVS